MNKELFIKALNTLFYSWGSDTPPEAYWAGNEFLDYFEAVNNTKLEIRFDGGYDDGDGWIESNYDEVIAEINKIF